MKNPTPKMSQTEKTEKKENDLDLGTLMKLAEGFIGVISKTDEERETMSGIFKALEPLLENPNVTPPQPINSDEVNMAVNIILDDLDEF